MDLKTKQDMKVLESMLVGIAIPRFKNIEDFIAQRDTTEKRFYIDKTKIIGLATNKHEGFTKYFPLENLDDDYALVDSFELKIINTQANPQLECICLNSEKREEIYHPHELYIDGKYLSDVIGMLEGKCKLFISKWDWRPLIVETEIKDKQDQTYYFAVAPVYPEDS